MLLYLLKFSISLAVLYIFYRAVLRPLTFYQCNRFYLLCYSLLSFAIPFIDVSFLFPHSNEPQLVNMIPVIGNYNFTVVQNGTASFFQQLTISDWLLLLFSAGTLFMLIKLLRQYISLLSVRKKSVLLDADAGVKLFETDAMVSPFSFGNAIYFNRQLHTEEELQRIIQHEFVHVKQRHTVDLLIGELLCIVNWFNPFAWLIRYSIRQNLEFIADNKVVSNGLDKKEYQYLLLKVVGVPQYSIANNFNFSNLKKRIIMMNKIKTSKLHLTKFLFVLPLMAVLFLAFRKKENNKNNPVNIISADALLNDTTPLPQPPASSVDVLSAVPPQSLPDNVANISTNNTTDKKKGIHTYTAVVTLKNGGKETYNLYDPKEKDAYIKKYGELPSIVLPPPPPPSAPVPAGIIFQKDTTAPPLNKKGYVVTIADNNGECVVIVKSKEQKIVKAITLTEWNNNKNENERKYGEIPPPPPPPPVPGGATITMPDPPGVVLRGLSNGQQPLYVVNGIEKTNLAEVKAIDPQTIRSINVLKDKRATDKYGNKAKNGAIEIITGIQVGVTDANSQVVERVDEMHAVGLSPVYDDSIASLSKPNVFKDVLIIVDGKEMPVGVKLEDCIKPENIASINVIKDKTAVAVYGEKAKNGVLLIKSKPANLKLSPVIKADTITVKVHGQISVNGSYRAEGNVAYLDGDLSFPKEAEMQPIVFYNGKEVQDLKSFVLHKKKLNIFSLDPKQAIAKYGDKAKYGALEILSL